MDEEKKKRIAEFRFGVIADLIGHRKLSWGERGRLLEEKASQSKYCFLVVRERLRICMSSNMR